MRVINMAQALLTAWGEQHGLIGQLPNAVQDNDFKYFEPKQKEEKKKERKEDARIVRARYINHEEKERGRLKKPYMKYAGDPILLFNLIHDYEYMLPMGFIKEVNSYKMPVREGLQMVDGKEVNPGAKPTERDSFKRVHELVPCAFT
jgi:hypothetical protein